VPYLDISIELKPGTSEWPGDTPFSCGWTGRIAQGSSVNLSSIAMSPHVGTHADAPLHVADGWPACEALDIDAFLGPAVVLGIEQHEGAVEFADLEDRLPPATARLLLRTGSSIASGRFPERWPVVSPDCARTLGVRGVRLVGVDAPSVDERESKTLETHRSLFEAGIQILENLDLRAVPDGTYELIALPLRLVGLDAAPVRAVLVTP
jgi:arylformamidase